MQVPHVVFGPLVRNQTTGRIAPPTATLTRQVVENASVVKSATATWEYSLPSGRVLAQHVKRPNDGYYHAWFDPHEQGNVEVDAQGQVFALRVYRGPVQHTYEWTWRKATSETFINYFRRGLESWYVSPLQYSFGCLTRGNGDRHGLWKVAEGGAPNNIFYWIGNRVPSAAYLEMLPIVEQLSVCLPVGMARRVQKFV
jgi:hypothetical protein